MVRPVSRAALARQVRRVRHGYGRVRQQVRAGTTGVRQVTTGTAGTTGAAGTTGTRIRLASHTRCALALVRNRSDPRTRRTRRRRTVPVVPVVPVVPRRTCCTRRTRRTPSNPGRHPCVYSSGTLSYHVVPARTCRRRRAGRAGSRGRARPCCGSSSRRAPCWRARAAAMRSTLAPSKPLAANSAAAGGQQPARAEPSRRVD